MALFQRPNRNRLDEPQGPDAVGQFQQFRILFVHDVPWLIAPAVQLIDR